MTRFERFEQWVWYDDMEEWEALVTRGANHRHTRKIVYANRLLCSVVLAANKLYWHRYTKGFLPWLGDYGALTNWGMVLTSVTCMIGMFVPVVPYDVATGQETHMEGV